MAGSRLLELISSLRRERPRYKLTKHCLYLATVSHLTPRPALPSWLSTNHVVRLSIVVVGQHVAMLSRSTSELHRFLTELLEDGRAALPADLCRALPATLLRATETFLGCGDLIRAMGSLDAMRQLDVQPEERTIMMV
jgi:hypothetical protein